MIRNRRFPSLAWVALCALIAPMSVFAADETLVLTHGGEGQKPLSRRAELRIPSSAIGAGDRVTLTSLGAQSLPGLLPLGWSPLGSAEIVSSEPAWGASAELSFDVPRDELIATGQTLTAVRYQEDRDEWRVLVAAVNVSSDGKATIAIVGPGAYALVYPDKAPHLQSPPAPASGGVLMGVADPCATQSCPPLVAKSALELTPPAVLPTQRTIATLRIEGSGTAVFPSGTAVQAYVDEELHLADGTRDVVSPFVTDLLLYRNLAGDTGVAEFHLAPSTRAAEVVLEVGYDHIRIVPYPERLDRGALIGPEGGRVPADDLVAVEIPAAATTEALKATATSIRDFASYGSIPGYRIVGGLALSLQWASAPAGEEVNPVELLKPARATFTVNDATLPSQLILVEVLEGTAYGRVYRLASQITALEGGTRFSTKTIDRAVLPVEGIIREGTYLLLAPDATIAFATGTVHLGVDGPATANARVLTPTLGVVDITRLTGIFNVPVPAAAFTLIPRTPQTGDGTAYNHATAPAIDEVVHVGALSIVAQPPSVSLSVFAHVNGSLTEVAAAGASNVSLTTSAKASFSPGVDPLSVRDDSIVVIDESDGSVVPGRAVAQGSVAILWTLTAPTRLRADARYTAVVSGAVRGANGAPLGTSVIATFTTPDTLSDPNVDPSKIRITMPDAEGRAQIIGAPGALAEHWNAVAVRRGRDFSTRPQATADANRSFLVRLGESSDPSDRITIADVLYLQIINEAGSVAAIIPLGPFTTDDNRGFVVRPDVETHYTTVDNVTLSVPAGAFDTPTVVHIEPAPQSAIVDVPSFDEELDFHAGFKIDFEGIAKKRIDLTFPTPATLAEGQSIYVGQYGQSARGPRIMIIDLLRRDGANLTTVHPAGSSSRGVASNAIINPSQARDMLLGIDRASILIGTSFETNGYVAWVTMTPPPVRLDLFVPPLDSVYYASFAMERDRILVPIPANGAFTVVGVDPSSGLTLFEAPYTAHAPGEPLDATELPLPSTNDRGPYPVFTSPGRTEILDVLSESFTDESIRNIVAEFDGKNVLLKNATKPLRPQTRVEAINLSTGSVAFSPDFASTASLQVPASVGDRIVLLIADHDVDPASILTVVFNEPINKGTQEQLREQFRLLVADPAVEPLSFVPDAAVSDIELDSGGRRISIIRRGSFQRGKIYRLRLSSDIRDRDDENPLYLGQAAGSPKPGDLHLDFTTRAPKGLVGAFDVPAGAVRDLTMTGNVLLITALEGGILAYDASNPAAMGTKPPFARIEPPTGSGGQSWGIAADAHDRFYATGVSPMYGVVRAYRVEDLDQKCGGGGCPQETQRGNAIIAWRTGINVGMPLSSLLIGGWPEAIPRKMQVVTRDDTPVVKKFEELAGSGTEIGNGFRKATINVEAGGAFAYDKQRVTVTNTTRNYRWAVDVAMGGSASVTIIGQPQDRIEIVRNLSTLGVVSLYGYGLGVYDLNAVEANSRNLANPDWQRLQDTIVTTDGDYEGASACDRAAKALIGQSCEIGSLRLSPEAAVTPGIGDEVAILALEQTRGVVHLTVTPGEASSFGRRGSMVFAERILIPDQGARWFGHPRLNQLRRLYRTASGRDPYARYTSIGTFRRDGKTYALVAGYEYGVLVVRLDASMTAESLVDVIWIPAGAQSLRISDGHQLATVVDGKGRVLLVNLAEIDESAKMDPETPCSSIDCEWELFPTALAALTGTASSGSEVGADDPRIVWKSPDSTDPLVFGTLAPWFDPETGFLYAGSVTTKKVSIVSAVDPRVRFVGDTGTGALQRLDQIVPLGIKPKAGSVSGENGSLAAFRVEAILPGSLAESLEGNPVFMSLESEPVLDATAPQTPEPLPRANLRSTGLRPVTNFTLIHDAPLNTSDPEVARLRYQRGWNRMVTPWIVAIADPRASEKYVWPAGANKEAEGCFACERPTYLEGRPEPEVFELYSAGRVLKSTPETDALFGDWAFLGQMQRLEERVNTIMADTVRPANVLVAAEAPPVAGGLLQETTYLHSGEIETSAMDFDAGGRAGWNVVVDRTYRSRTLFGSALGMGWDSSLFRRLRVLPDGSVEYRDGSELWTFQRGDNGKYKAPDGVALRLERTDRGWTLTDQKWRIVTFDDLGRIIRESDEFYKPSDPSSGNVIHYGYDAAGRLASIVDPVGRRTTLKYPEDESSPFAGLLQQIEDWHSQPRKIDFEYDGQRRLTNVKLPEVVNTSGSRPAIRYTYFDSSPAAYKDLVELRTNLESVIDPGETSQRVKFTYETSGDNRDRVSEQNWATGEHASFAYPSATSATVTDVLGQVRKYTLTANDTTNPLADRSHVTTLIEQAVPVWTGAPFGQLPEIVTAGAPAVANEDRTWAFAYAGGMLTSSTLAGVRETTVGYTSNPQVPGKIVSNATTAPVGGGGAAAPAWMPATSAITTQFHYQTMSNGASFLEGTSAGGLMIESPEPHRNNTTPSSANDNITASAKYDANGLLREAGGTGGTDPSGAGSKSKIEPWPATAAKHMRSMPHFIREGEGANELVTTLEYPSETETKETDPRGVVTTTDLDAWNRPTRVRIEKLGDPLVIEERYEYAAAGRTKRVIRRKGTEDVTTTYDYDDLGRRTSTTTDQIASVGSITTTVVYDLSNRKTVTTQPGGATTTTQTDGLGRAISSVTATGSSPIEQHSAYDKAGNRVYSTDMFVATANAYDAHGRVVATRYSDGTITTSEHDAWGRATKTKTLTPAATETVSESSVKFTPSGRVEEIKAKLDDLTERTTSFAWDGGGRTTGTATNGRASRSTFDLAGRPLLHMAGAGDATALNEIFASSEISAHSGAMPVTTKTTEKNAPPVTTTTVRNTTGSVTETSTGSLQWKQQYDALGNVTEASVPGRPSTQWDVDARGAVKQETLPDGAANQYAYHGSGAQSGYTDPTSEATSTTTDLIGRPVSRAYPDGTTETIVWEGSRLKEVTDRQGRKQTFVYNAKGQLDEVRDGSSAVLDKIVYDDAGRMISWKTPDVVVTWSEFDMEGRPKKTTQKRFRDASGFTTETVLDEFTQEHRWNEYGERVRASMPAYSGMTFAAGWTKWIVEDHDAMGNVTSIARAEDATSAPTSTIMSATYRNAGRPESRTVTTAGGGAPIVRTYAYDPVTSLLKSVTVSNAKGVIAGSEVTYDGLQKASARMLGVSSGERYQHWSYDVRSRVAAALYGTMDPTANPLAAVPGRGKDDHSPADFRNAHERTPSFDSATSAALAAKGVDQSKIDPPTSSFTESGGGHKIAQMSKGPVVRPFGYNGAERIDDGRFIYEFDVKGRLVRATEKATIPPIRRATYTYSGTNRVVGRRAEYATVASPVPADWRLEDRPPILSADGLPAETTFVWDPITDRLVSVFKAGATPVTDANGGLLKQIIHGESDYDDPLETATVDPFTGVVTHLYPIYDEAATGSLQAIVNTTGEVVARNLSNDPYGAEDVALAGAAVDGVKLEVKKASGAVEMVKVTLHATEALSEATVAAGARLATVDSTGHLVRTATDAPTLDADDPFSITWTLSAAEWAALTDPTPVTVDGAERTPVGLSIAATSTLRATNWSAALPVLPPPDWVQATKAVHTSGELPVEVRESLTSVNAFVSTIGPDETKTSNLYTVDSLTLLGTPGSDGFSEDIVSARMHAHPFTEPMTGLNYVRNRWYDPATGTFLSPDPMGYADSSNLYAFAKGDPVNGRDPLGLEVATTADGSWYVTNPKNGKRHLLPIKWIRENPLAAQDIIRFEGGLSLQATKDWMYDHDLQFTHDYYRPVVRKDLPEGDNWAMNALIATSGLPPQNRQQQIVQGGLQIVGTAAMIKSAKSNLNRGIATTYPVKQPEEPLKSYWELEPKKRGEFIEADLAETEYKGWHNWGAENNGYGELIDFAKGPQAISLKTSNAQTNSVLSTLRNHIDDLSTRGAEIGGKPAQMGLDIRVPPGMEQKFIPLLQYGAERGVRVRVVVYEKAP